MEQSDGWRCWLSQSEQDRIVDYYSEQPKKQLAIELMLDGLRSEETTRVSKEDFRELEGDGEESAWVVRVWESKTGYREAPVSDETKQRGVMLANARGLSKGESLIDVTERTVQRWVTEACESIGNETGNDDWHKVSAHDLRRTWGTSAYYRLISEGGTTDVREVIMQWGGWDDEDTFRNNYLGRVPDSLQSELMHAAELS
jgi:integrase